MYIKIISSSHVEVVCQLSNHRRRPDSYVKLEVDAEDYYRIKDGENKVIFLP